MDQELITRINELAHKAKSTGLTEAEQAEREELRAAYRAAFKANLVNTLEHTTVVDENGKVIRKLHKT